MVEQRVAKGWKQQDVFDLVRDHFEWGPTSVSLYGDIERGKRDLTEADKRVLAGLYGKTPADVHEPAKVEPTPDLATAIWALTEELREARHERRAMAAQVEEMDAVLRNLVARTSAIEGEHDAHPHSAGSGR